MSIRKTRGIVATAFMAAVTLCVTVAGSSVAVDSAGAVDRVAGLRAAKPGDGSVALVQAVPRASMTITIDGRTIQQGVAEGKIIGPVALAAGSHQVAFADAATTISSTVQVSAGKTSDVVVHRPAAVGGTPVVSVYPNPDKPLGPGKSRVLLAHTATTAPADVVVDGQTVFTDIANGEYAEADVPSGSHEVSLVPSGVAGAKPILGPLTVDLKAGTLTAVYAVGNPKDNSMNVIVRTTTVGTSGGAPNAIDTGSAGLVGDVQVHPFATH